MPENGARKHPAYVPDPWSVIEEEFNPDSYAFSEGVLALANGYLGIRASFEEGLCFGSGRRGHYAATVFNARPHPTVITLKGCPANPREIVNLPDFTCLRIFIEGDPLDLGTCEIHRYRRVLQMDRGMIIREAELETPGGVQLSLTVTSLVSRQRPHVAAFRFTMRAANRDVPIAIEAGIDGKITNADGRSHFSEYAPEADPDGQSSMRCRTSESNTEVAIVCHDVLTCMDSACDTSSEKNQFAGLWFDGTLYRGETSFFTRIAAIASTADPDVPAAPGAIARQELKRARQVGFDGLVKEQCTVWGNVWREAGISLRTGLAQDDSLLQGIRYAFFQLFQHTGAGLPVAARGLVCERASGGTSWDKSLFTLPALALLRPQEAERIVRHRICQLPQARAKAAEMGLDGAMFPWTAGAEGEETCPLWQFSLMGLHATAAVAWGVWFTFKATDDIALLAEGGIDLLVETARFWAARTFRQNESSDYELRGVVGLDEYHQGVDNDFYTNALARWNLKIVAQAVDTLEKRLPTECVEARRRLELSAQEMATFAQIAERMRIPYAGDRGLSLEFEGVDRLEPVAIPENRLGHPLDEEWTFDRLMRSRILRRAGVVTAQILLADCGDLQQRVRDFEYYNPITTHDSPMSICHHAIAAAQIGKAEQAMELFSRIVRLDLDDVLGNSWLGPHVSCLAGVWQCLVHGFLGVSLASPHLSLTPNLPSGWKELRMPIVWHGKRVDIWARQEAVTVAIDSGTLNAEINGRMVTLSQMPLKIPRAGQMSSLHGTRAD